MSVCQPRRLAAAKRERTKKALGEEFVLREHNMMFAQKAAELLSFSCSQQHQHKIAFALRTNCFSNFGKVKKRFFDAFNLTLLIFLSVGDVMLRESERILNRCYRGWSNKFKAILHEAKLKAEEKV